MTTTSTKQLAKLDERIRKANGLAGRSFPQWITVVGEALDEARRLMPAGTFAAWATDEHGWSKPHVYHLLKAAEVVRTMEAEGVASRDLPEKESWCRELATLQVEAVCGAWSDFRQDCRDAGTKITQTAVRDWVSLMKADPFSEDGDGDGDDQADAAEPQKLPPAAAKMLDLLSKMERLAADRTYEITDGLDVGDVVRRLDAVGKMLTNTPILRADGNDQQSTIMAALSLGPATRYELGDRCHLQSEQVGKRLHELEQLGLASKTDTTRKGPKGRQCAVWEIVPEADTIDARVQRYVGDAAADVGPRAKAALWHHALYVLKTLAAGIVDAKEATTMGNVIAEYRTWQPMSDLLHQLNSLAAGQADVDDVQAVVKSVHIRGAGSSVPQKLLAFACASRRCPNPRRSAKKKPAEPKTADTPVESKAIYKPQDLKSPKYLPAAQQRLPAVRDVCMKHITKDGKLTKRDLFHTFKAACNVHDLKEAAAWEAIQSTDGKPTSRNESAAARGWLQGKSVNQHELDCLCFRSVRLHLAAFVDEVRNGKHPDLRFEDDSGEPVLVQVDATAKPAKKKTAKRKPAKA